VGFLFKIGGIHQMESLLFYLLTFITGIYGQFYINILQVPNISNTPESSTLIQNKRILLLNEELIINNAQQLKDSINLHKNPENVTSICFEDMLLNPDHIKDLGLHFTHVDSISFINVKIQISDEKYDKFEQEFFPN